MDIVFDKIRPLNGSQRDGFEEMTSSLFCSEFECDGDFTRVEGSGGDGGVEAYWTNSEGCVTGFQSKFFEKVRSVQWKQIDKSVSATLKNHAGLNRYVIAVPCDLTPAQKKTWDGRRNNWNEKAKELGWKREIHFEWWGASKLRELLIESRYRSKAWYWFGSPDFSLEWLAKRNHLSFLQLGKRYSPKEHLDTDAGRFADAFAWGETAKKQILAKFVATQKAWVSLLDSLERYTIEDGESKELVLRLAAAGKEIEEFRWPDKGYPNLTSFYKVIEWTNGVSSALSSRVEVLDYEYSEENEAQNFGRDEKYGGVRRALREYGDTLSYLDAAVWAARFANFDRLILKGEAGSGKSHLIADVVEDAGKRQQPALLLLGERFTVADEPWSQVCQQIGWNHGVEELLSCLNEEAKLEGRPAMICIDALNETEHRILWRNHLIAFASRIENFPFVKLLISCRTDYLDLVVPKPLLPTGEESWSWIDHSGFGDEVIEAVEIYFKAHGIVASHFPPVLEEFRNPLFLRVFCEAFEGKEFPVGMISLKMVMEQRVRTLCDKLFDEANCDPADTREALSIVAKAMAVAGGDAIPREEVRRKINFLHPSTNGSPSLFQRILSSGMLVETRKWMGESEKSVELVRFPFERFSDYFIAEELLSEVETEQDLSEAFQKGGSLAHLLSGYWQFRGLGRALAVLIPEKFRNEAAEYLLAGAFLHEVLEDFLFSLPWRGAESFSSSTDKLIQQCWHEEADVLESLLRVSSIPGHPYNSDYLLNWMLKMDQPKKELNWTIPISAGGIGWGKGQVVDQVVNWSSRVPLHLLPDGQALLVGRVLILLCSSNWQGLRDRASRGAIRILNNRPKVMMTLLRELEEIGDPYILERLFAAAAGVSMRHPGGEDLSLLASEVYRQVFGRTEVPPNIAIRDFAQSVMENSLYKKSLPEGVEASSFRPPFKSSWPSIQDENAVLRFRDDDDWASVYQSVIPEGMGHYGDFGRYTMGATVHQFSDRRLSGLPPEKRSGAVFSAAIAMRWILQRVEELGWDPDVFEEYESNLPSQGRNRVDIEEQRIERISKKYQKIALRELMGYLSDHFHLAFDYGEAPKPFRGAWEIWGRDFDPSSTVGESVEGDELEEDDTDGFSSYRNELFFSDDVCGDREKWVITSPPDFTSIIEPHEDFPDGDSQWVTIGGHFRFNESDYDAIRLSAQGKLKMWLDIRSFLVKKSELKAFIQKAKKGSFWGEGVDIPGVSDGWLGEYPWGRVFHRLRKMTASRDSWLKEPIPDHINTCCHIRSESSRVPTPQLLEILSGRWSGYGEEFVSDSGELVFGHIDGNASKWGRACVVRRDRLRDALAENDLEIVWCSLSEKSCWCSEKSEHVVTKHLQVSSVHWMDLKSGLIKGGTFDEHLHDFSDYYRR